jgi:hypothetical protein
VAGTIARLTVPLLVVILALAALVLASTGEPKWCDLGNDAYKARLLGQSELAYARGDCDAGLKRARKRQAMATRAAARAEVQLEAARRIRVSTKKEGEPKRKTARRRRAKKRKLARTRAARRELRRAAVRDPFAEGVLGELNTALRHVKPKPAGHGPEARARAREAREQSCRRVGRFIDWELPDQAQILLAGSARRGFRRTCRHTRTRLALLRARARKNLGKARAADQDDDWSKARRKYALALLLDPSLPEAKQALEAERDDSTDNLDAVADWLESKPGELDDELAWILPLLVVLAVASFLSVRWLASRSRRNQRSVEEAARFPFGWMRRAAVLRVRVAVEGEGGSPPTGADISALLLDALTPPRAVTPSNPFDRVWVADPASATTEVGKFLAVLPSGKIAAAALTAFDRVFRGRTAEVTGRLLPAGAQGAGLELTVASPPRPKSYSVTLWERKFYKASGADGAERWYRLVVPAATWLRWYLRPFVPGESSCPPPVREWRAEAFYEAGLALGADLVRSQMLFARSLDEDPTHIPAAVNLAVTEIRSGMYSAAIRRLRAVRGRLRTSEEHNPRERTLWVSATYNLAVARGYRGEELRAKKDSEAAAVLQRAVRTAEGLVEYLARSPAEGESNHALELPAVVMLASMRIRAAGDASAADPDPGGGALMREELASDVADLSAGDLVERYVRPQRPLPGRTRYNLACYFTAVAAIVDKKSQGKRLDEALTNLDLGLEDGTLVEWARKDPSLNLLHELRESEFERTLERHTPAADAPADADEAPVPPERADYAAMRTRLRTWYLDWLEERGHSPTFEPPGPGMRFEAIVEGVGDGKILVDASAGRRPDQEGLENFVADTRRWSGKPERVFLVPRDAHLSGPFLEYAKEKQVAVYGVSRELVERRELG